MIIVGIIGNLHYNNRTYVYITQRVVVITTSRIVVYSHYYSTHRAVSSHSPNSPL